MATITIYSQEDNRSFQVNIDLSGSILDTDQGRQEYYLTVSTSMTYPDGSLFPIFLVKTLSDVPPGYPAPASDFNELINYYVDFFVAGSQIAASSSSSYSSSSSESSSSSSSSSFEYSSSSESSSSKSSVSSESSSSSSSSSESSSSSSESSSSSSSSSESSSSSTLP